MTVEMSWKHTLLCLGLAVAVILPAVQGQFNRCPGPGLFPSDSGCSQYLACGARDGDPTIMNCPVPLNFDPATGNCLQVPCNRQQRNQRQNNNRGPVLNQQGPNFNNQRPTFNNQRPNFNQRQNNQRGTNPRFNLNNRRRPNTNNNNNNNNNRRQNTNRGNNPRSNTNPFVNNQRTNNNNQRTNNNNQRFNNNNRGQLPTDRNVFQGLNDIRLPLNSARLNQDGRLCQRLQRLINDAVLSVVLNEAGISAVPRLVLDCNIQPSRRG